MKKLIYILIIIMSSFLVEGIILNNSNIFISGGGQSIESNNYKTLIAVGDIMITTLNQSNNSIEMGWVDTLLKDDDNPIVTLLSPINYTVLSEFTINFTYNVSDVNIFKCLLYFDSENIANQSVNSSGEYNIIKTVPEQFGDIPWYIECWDKANNRGNSSIEFLNYPVPKGITGGGGGSGVSGNFKFVKLNRFETSYIHRSEILPLPSQKVNFTVFIKSYNTNDDVLFNYSFDKINWTVKNMLPDVVNKSFYTDLGGFPPRTLIYYFVTAQRGNNKIRTPISGYDGIVWDNPPINETEKSKLFSIGDLGEIDRFRIGKATGIFLGSIIIFFMCIILIGKKEGIKNEIKIRLNR